MPIDRSDSTDSPPTLYFALEYAADGVMLIDAHSIISYANPAACAMFCCEREELLEGGVGHLLLLLEGEEEKERMCEAFSRSRQSLLEVCVRGRCGERSRRWIECALPPLAEGRPRAMTCRDITGRKDAEQRQRRNMENADKRNLALKRALEKEKLLREISGKISGESDIHSLAAGIAEKLGTAYRVDRCLIWNNNALADTPMYFHGEYCADGVTAFADFDSRKINAALAGVLSPRHPLIVYNDVRREAPALLEHRQPPLSAMLAGAFFQGRLNGFLALHQCGNARPWLAGEIEVMETVARHMGIAIEHYRANFALREAQAESEQKAFEMSRLLSKGRRLMELQTEFVSMVSHEFRTPLAIIDSSAQLMQRKLHAPWQDRERILAYQDEHIEKIRRSIRRMISLIDSTLSFSQMEIGNQNFQPGPVDLPRLVRDVCARYQEINRGQRFDLDLDALPGDFHADRGMLDQVLTNLCSNACKYSPADGVIEIKGRALNGRVTISVTDRGIGIAEADQERLFQKFFRAGNSMGIPGTGLGLYLSSKLVERHGGCISIKSALNSGSTFTVTLPMAETEEKKDGELREGSRYADNTVY